MQKLLNTVINYFKGDPSSPEVECVKSGDKMRRAFYNIGHFLVATLDLLAECCNNGTHHDQLKS